MVTSAMLPLEIMHHGEAVAAAPVQYDMEVSKPTLTLNGLVGLTMAEIEQLVIEETIAQHGGSIPKAARVLDLSPSTIYRKRENWTKP